MESKLIKIIESCQTIEQADILKDWIDRTILSTDDKLYYNRIIQRHRLQLLTKEFSRQLQGLSKTLIENAKNKLDSME